MGFAYTAITGMIALTVTFALPLLWFILSDLRTVRLFEQRSIEHARERLAA